MVNGPPAVVTTFPPRVIVDPLRTIPEAVFVFSVPVKLFAPVAAASLIAAAEMLAAVTPLALLIKMVPNLVTLPTAPVTEKGPLWALMVKF